MHDIFNHSIAITLPERKDRLIQLIDSISPINPKIFQAIKPLNKGKFRSIGEHGCCLSHLEVVKYIKKQNFPQCIIFEDDCRLVDDFWTKIDSIIDEINTLEFDIFYFYNWKHLYQKELKIIKDKTICQHMYLVRKSSYDKIINILNNAIKIGKPGDQALYFSDLNCYTTNINLAYQDEGYSDLTESFRDKRG